VNVHIYNKLDVHLHKMRAMGDDGVEE